VTVRLKEALVVRRVQEERVLEGILVAGQLADDELLRVTP